MYNLKIQKDMEMNNQFKREERLENFATIFLILGILTSVICLICSFVCTKHSDGFNLTFFLISIGVLLESLLSYFILVVIAEISSSLKRNKNDMEYYAKSIDNRLSSINKILNKKGDGKFSESKKEDNKTDQKKYSEMSKPQAIQKEEPKVIDNNGEEFKRRLHKWEALKKNGLTDQAINEYQEYTGLDYEEAVEFINEL
jgi:hypothetical protein